MVKQILFLFFLILLFFGQFITNVKGDCVTNGLVLWLRFDEGSGNIAYDYSGHNNNGVLVNNPTWVQGVYGYALQFNGINQSVQVPYNSILNVTTYTISFWFNQKSASTVNYEVIINFPGILACYFDSSNNLWCGFPSRAVGVFQPSLNTWYYIVAVNNGTQCWVNVNGQVTTGAWSCTAGSASGSPFYIGYNNGFNGIIDDVRIYNRVLSQAEIQQIYSQTQPYFCKFTTSTTVYQNQIVQTNTQQGYNYVGIDPFNLGVLALIFGIGIFFFFLNRKLILIGVGIGFLIAYFFLGINIGFVLLGFIFIILNIILLRRYE